MKFKTHYKKNFCLIFFFANSMFASVFFQSDTQEKILLEKIRIAIAQNKFDRAKNLLEKISNNTINLAQKNFLRAHIHLQNKNLSMQKKIKNAWSELLNQAHLIQRNKIYNDEYFLLMARLLLEQSQFSPFPRQISLSHSVTYFNALSSAGPLKTQAQLGRTYAFLQQRKFNEALASLNEINNKKMRELERVESNYLQSLAFFNLCQFDSAQIFAKKVLRFPHDKKTEQKQKTKLNQFKTQNKHLNASLEFADKTFLIKQKQSQKKLDQILMKARLLKLDAELGSLHSPKLFAASQKNLGRNLLTLNGKSPIVQHFMRIENKCRF